MLGPLAKYFLVANRMYGFGAQRDVDTGDVWFSVLQGQLFRVSAGKMQYCFSKEKELAEQSPFSINSTSEDDISFCWRTGLKGMPTHRPGCQGCECASILIKLTSPNTTEFTFWQSPPVIHARINFQRAGPPPQLDELLSSLKDPYQQCTMKDQYGPNSWHPAQRRGVRGCAAGFVARSRTMPAMLTTDQGQCWQLNGVNLALHNETGGPFDIPDVKLQYTLPLCDSGPCLVSYSVSALIGEHDYIALGFKGESWEGKFYANDTNRTDLINSQRPCYFGMCVDPYDNFTSDRIALGYAADSYGSSCFREMISTEYVGAPSDVTRTILSKTSVSRVNGRTVLRFTVPQDQNPHVHHEPFSDGPFRVMWAIGKVFGKGCSAKLGYHGKNRAVHPIEWLSIGSTACKFEPTEFEEPTIWGV